MEIKGLCDLFWISPRIGIRSPENGHRNLTVIFVVCLSKFQANCSILQQFVLFDQYWKYTVRKV
jgi:hypothetical protein